MTPDAVKVAAMSSRLLQARSQGSAAVRRTMGDEQARLFSRMEAEIAALFAANDVDVTDLAVANALLVLCHSVSAVLNDCTLRGQQQYGLVQAFNTVACAGSIAARQWDTSGGSRDG